MRPPLVLGLAASHSGAACLLRGDEIVAAVQEERLTRVKRATLKPAEPFAALDYLLRAAEVGVSDLDLVALCPLQPPAHPDNDLDRHPLLARVPRLTVSHHLGHAAGAFAMSGFANAVVVVVDGQGSRGGDLPAAERACAVGPPTGRETVSVYAGALEGGRVTLTPLHKQLATQSTPELGHDWRPRMPPANSLGTLYQSVAWQIFGGWQHAGKVMGLAAWGRPSIEVDAFLTCEAGGAIDGSRLAFEDGVAERFRTDARWPLTPEAYQDLASSAQRALEVGLDAVLDHARTLSSSPHLVLCGGVAMNGLANESLVFRRPDRFAEAFIMPASEDSGTAIGAAHLGLWHLGGTQRLRRARHDFLGADLGLGAPSERTIGQVADLLAAGGAVGWVHGRSEFGPRALGHRSILMDPRPADGKSRLDREIKCREPFRPYAPAVLAEHAAEWFDLGPVSGESPFMLRVVPFADPQRARQTVPSVVHVDGTGRLQTLAPDGSALRRLVEAFHLRTGVPMVLNTSLNRPGEPLVETAADARACFEAMALDALVIGDVLIRRG